MERRPEPELMLAEEQARAYAEADFEEPHNRFVELFQETFPDQDAQGYVLDLGCGPADVSLRFARAYPGCIVHGVDASKTMLNFGNQAIRKQQLEDRVQLFQSYLPTKSLPLDKYDAVMSNSLLHHLRDPQVLWETIKQFAGGAAPVFVMDLMRPTSETQAKELTQTYAQGEPEILKRDFYNSLLAAYRPGEIESHLEKARLAHFSVRVISDRHLIVHGRSGDAQRPLSSALCARA
ncbi:class I SAM-dependent methyltransferase [Acidobacteria bacterium AH-259-O06]|nr:class I SAM-dependent methyltransferase [Acidobacteria bacterium AH-259-O06]